MTSSVIEVLERASQALIRTTIALEAYVKFYDEMETGQRESVALGFSAIADLRAALAELPKSDPAHLAAGETTRTSGPERAQPPRKSCQFRQSQMNKTGFRSSFKTPWRRQHHD